METITVSVDENVSTIEIDRPDVLNALNSQVRVELTAAIREANETDSTRAVVITGSGERAFSAGQDINESQDFHGEDAKEWVREFDSLYAEILSLDIPVVAKLNGVATGSGFQVALLCDIRIASADATVGMNEINIGIPCILGGWMIERVAGYMAAVELTLTGELVSAERAKEIGLINRVVSAEKLDETVDELAENLATKPPVSMKWQKKWLRELRFDDSFETVSRRSEEIHSEVYQSGEPETYMKKFLDGE